MTLKEMQDKRHGLAKNAREILSKAESEGREMTAEDRSTFDKLDAEITELDGDIGRAKRSAQLGDAPAAPGAGEFEHETDEQREAQNRAEAARIADFREQHGRDPEAAELAGLSGVGSQRQIARDLAEYRALTYGGQPQNADEFRQAFYKYLTVRNLAAEFGADEHRVLSTATNAAGGYIVPATFEKTLLTRARDFGVMRELATVITTTTGETITQPAEDTHGTAAWLATNAAYTESDEAFQQITLSAYKAGTLMRVAEELLQDSAFDLEAYIAQQFAARIGILENTAYVVGNGTGKPTGITVSAPVGYTLPTGNTVGFTTAGAVDGLLELYHSVIQAYRNRGVWLMRDATVLGIRKLKDTTGQYLWQPGISVDRPDTLLGRPLYTDPDMPAMAANAKAVLFGDFSYYTIRDVAGVGIQRLNELYAANGQVGYRAYHRTEGKLVNTDAVKALAMSAT